MKKALKWVAIALALIGLGLAVTGLFLDFMQTGIGSATEGLTLFDNIIKIEETMATVIVAFSIMTAGFAFLTFLSTLLLGRARGLRIINALLTIACAIVAIVVTAVYASENSASIIGSLGVSTVPAIGAYLLVAGGALAGIAGLLPTGNKN